MSNFLGSLDQVDGGLPGTGPRFFTASTPDSLTTITAAGYLNDVIPRVKLNDIIWINYSDTSTFPLSPVSGTASGENSTFGQFIVTYSSPNYSLSAISPLMAKSRTALTAAQWNGMYATPVQLVGAAGANTILLVDHINIGLTYVSTTYAAGGVVGAQYGSTAHLAAPAASATEAAADFFATASTLFRLGAGVSTGAPYSTCANTGLYLSNATGAFTTGNGTFLVDTYYYVVPTV